jgi:hypothetical protein
VNKFSEKGRTPIGWHSVCFEMVAQIREETTMPMKTASERDSTPPFDPGIIELSLMLSRDQFDALEVRAQAAGLSVAQFLRRLVSDSIAEDAAYA